MSDTLDNMLEKDTPDWYKEIKKIKLERPITPADEWKDRLVKKYPKLFRQKDLSMKETCMCWGIAVDIGWLPIIEFLCESIQGYVDLYTKVQVEFSQIKEKYGILRIYTDNADEYVNNLVDMAERLSGKVCEDCGSVVDVTTKGGYILTLCKVCRNRRGKLSAR